MDQELAWTSAGDSMETEPNIRVESKTRTVRTLEIVHAVERVLQEINTDLSLAEAKLAQTHVLVARRRERDATSA